jgi:hypothetical protein
MKTIIIFALFIGVALALSIPPKKPPTSAFNPPPTAFNPPPSASGEPIAIVKSESDSHPDGSYSFSYESADGSAREETGVLKNGGTDEAYVAQSGSYKYIDVDGKPVEVHYTADENGFVPFGEIINDSISAAAKAASAA